MEALGGVTAGIAAAFLCTWVLNHVPAQWLCDYGEQPPAALLQKRVRLSHSAWFAALLCVYFLLLIRQFGPGLRLCLAGTAGLVLLGIAFSDLLWQIIPDQFTWLLASLGFLFQLTNSAETTAANLLRALLGAAAGGGFLLLLGILGAKLFHKEAMGGGDLKLFAAVGTFTGISALFPVFFGALLCALLHILYLTIHHRGQERSPYLPFGPSLCAAAAGYLVFYKQVNACIAWYLSLLAP